MDECEECRKREVFRTYNNRKLCVICYSAAFKADRSLGNWHKEPERIVSF